MSVYTKYTCVYIFIFYTISHYSSTKLRDLIASHLAQCHGLQQLQRALPWLPRRKATEAAAVAESVPRCPSCSTMVNHG
jgi:hypothetical protein